jgi:alpha-L-fucosidase
LADPTWGRITVKGNLVYLHIFTWPADGKLRVTGLRNTVLTAYPLLAPAIQLPVSSSFGTDSVSLPAERTDPDDTVVVLKLNSPPVAEPTVLTQGTDSPIHLDYASAITSGRAVKRFNREGGFHIAKWTGPNDISAWRILVSQAGAYHVHIRYSARLEAKGDRYRISIGDQLVAGVVEPTGEGYQYSTIE